MDWTESLKRAIDYMEQHLLEDISAEEVSKQVHISSFHFQRGFKLMTGYTIGEYLKGRRLYLAALECMNKESKVIDLAYKYGYDTPESFTKAFRRFHGVSPSHLKGDSKKIRPFLPLKISISIKGGNDMDYVIEKMKNLKLIGFEKKISYETAYQDIPAFWEEFKKKYCHKESLFKIISECCIGKYGICVDMNSKEFRYIIAGCYDGQAIPEGMSIIEIPIATWAKFKCSGPLPGALQSVNTKIYKEWLPGNPHYEFNLGMNIEYYTMDNPQASDYRSEIWIPVTEKE